MKVRMLHQASELGGIWLKDQFLDLQYNGVLFCRSIGPGQLYLKEVKLKKAESCIL